MFENFYMIIYRKTKASTIIDLYIKLIEIIFNIFLLKYIVIVIMQIKKIAIQRFSTTLVEEEALEKYCKGIYEIEELVLAILKIIHICI